MVKLKLSVLKTWYLQVLCNAHWLESSFLLNFFLILHDCWLITIETTWLASKFHWDINFYFFWNTLVRIIKSVFISFERYFNFIIIVQGSTYDWYILFSMWIWALFIISFHHSDSDLSSGFKNLSIRFYKYVPKLPFRTPPYFKTMWIGLHILKIHGRPQGTYFIISGIIKIFWSTSKQIIGS